MASLSLFARFCRYRGFIEQFGYQCIVDQGGRDDVLESVPNYLLHSLLRCRAARSAGVSVFLLTRQDLCLIRRSFRGDGRHFTISTNSNECFLCSFQFDRFFVV